jgi:putative ABC transport system substrate-binding protein
MSIDRRKVLSVLASLPLLSHDFSAAAQTTKPYRIGFMGIAPAEGWSAELAALREGLRELGYVEGTNVILDVRWTKDVGDLPDVANSFARERVDIIVAPASTQVEPALKATRSIPIVFTQHADPVGTGHVSSLSHPGGNVTGVSMLLTELSAKGLEILKQAIPNAEKVGVMWNPTAPSHAQVLAALERSAVFLGVQLVVAPARSVEDFKTAIGFFISKNANAFIVPSSPVTNANPRPLADLAIQERLPAMFGNKENVKAGGLMSYGADFPSMYRHAAVYIDKIIRGTRPSDLPVEQVSKFDLVINARTARQLGLEIQPWLLASATEIYDGSTAEP